MAHTFSADAHCAAQAQIGLAGHPICDFMLDTPIRLSIERGRTTRIVGGASGIGWYVYVGLIDVPDAHQPLVTTTKCQDETPKGSTHRQHGQRDVPPRCPIQCRVGGPTGLAGEIAIRGTPSAGSGWTMAASTFALPIAR